MNLKNYYKISTVFFLNFILNKWKTLLNHKKQQHIDKNKVIAIKVIYKIQKKNYSLIDTNKCLIFFLNLKVFFFF